MLDSTKDWVWFAHDDNASYSAEVYNARNFILNAMIPRMRELQWPVTHVYDNVAGTINVVFPREALVQDTSIRHIFMEAAFIEKPIPEHDWQGEQDLKKAILNGSDLNTKWN